MFTKRSVDDEFVRKIEAQKTTKVAHIFGGLLGRELPTPEKQIPVDSAGIIYHRIVEDGCIVSESIEVPPGASVKLHYDKGNVDVEVNSTP